MDNREFAEKIYTLRSEKGISQKELGDLLGVSNKAVSKWETGESMPKTATLLKISELFGMDINELMGGEVKEVKADGSDKELDSLKAENALLRSQIVKSDKKKKFNTVIAVVVCIAVIAAAGVFAFFSGRTEADNKGVKDLGKNGTSISFAKKEFEPFEPLDELFCDNDFLTDTKEAQYTDLGGKKSKILINSERYSDSICVSQGNKKYYYIPANRHIKLSAESIDSITVYYGKSVAKSSDNTYHYNEYYSGKAEGTFIKDFAEYYNSKKETKDKRAAELYLGNKGFAVEVSLNEKFKWKQAEIGEFFVGKDNKVYFYDYSDTKTYDVGKEMAKHVKTD